MPILGVWWGDLADLNGGAAGATGCDQCSAGSYLVSSGVLGSELQVMRIAHNVQVRIELQIHWVCVARAIWNGKESQRVFLLRGDRLSLM